MPTTCRPKTLRTARVDGRAVAADFGGGAITQRHRPAPVRNPGQRPDSSKKVSYPHARAQPRRLVTD